MGLKRAGLVFGGFARYFQRVLPDFEPFPPDFLQDFTQLPSKSLSLLLGEGNWGGGEGFGVKKGGSGAGLVFGALRAILTNFEPFLPNFLWDFTQSLSKSL